nr:nucleotide-binding alpha-beta plait domain-containing protein [Tanacetum cinerariifolium]
MGHYSWDVIGGTSLWWDTRGGTTKVGHQSEERLANNLCTVWMGRHKLIANISRFQRNNNKGGNKVGVENINNPVRKSSFVPKKSPGVNKDGSSYANVVSGFGVSIGDSVDKSPAMILDDECLVSSEFSNSLFGRVKEFASLANIKIALANEGFIDISIQYLGEYWILVKFSSQDARQLFRDSVSVGSWFSILKEASSDFHCDKRIAWVETEGIPFKLWTENTFKRIVSRWGVFLSVDDQEDSCFHSKRLCWVPDFADAYGDEDSDDAISNDEGDKNQNSNIFGDDDDAEDGQGAPSKGSSSSYTHPPGFSHMKGQEDKQGMENNNTQGKEDATGLNKNDKESVQPKHIEEVSDSVSTGYFKKSEEDRQFIEQEVSIDEIKKAVWDCGTDKASGPDGFTFGFYCRYWDLIHGEVTNAVRIRDNKSYGLRGERYHNLTAAAS